MLEHGDGPYVFDTHGRRYLDALSTLFCSQLGWSYRAEFGAVAAEQLERLAFASNWAMAHPSSVELAERVAELAPPGLDRVFFTSGGSESVEAAWKIVRHHHLGSGQPQRTKAIARDVAYHGTSLGALALTGVTAYKKDFGPRPSTPAMCRTRIASARPRATTRPPSASGSSPRSRRR